MSGSLPFRNVTTGVIPGFAVMRCVGSESRDGELTLQMNQPQAEFERFYYINGPTPVLAGQFGQCYLLNDAASVRYPVLIDPASEPAFGQTVGPQSGHWELFSGGYGFTLLGLSGSARVFARQQEVTCVQGVLTAALEYQATANVAVHGAAGDWGQHLLATDALLAESFRLPEAAPVVVLWLAGSWRVVSSAQAPEPTGG